MADILEVYEGWERPIATRTAAGESRQSIIGTLAAWEEQVNPYKQAVSVKQQFEGKEGRGQDPAASTAVFSRVAWKRDPRKPDGSYDFENAAESYHVVLEDATPVHRVEGLEITEANYERLNLTRDFIGRKHLNVSVAHHVARLPREFVGLNNGHCGSHQFLVDDFMRALDSGKLPPNHVWLAARFNAPGIVAHASATKGGALLDIPDFGRPPREATYLDSRSVLKD
ncbi:MAG: hypothetical protein JXR37_34130 [Kiritimatiellae bacterium]|nr:hypothetical protein [Kiritimatiellia bacterium]